MLFFYKCEHPQFPPLNTVRLKAQALMAYSYGFSIKNHVRVWPHLHEHIIKLLSTCFLFKCTKFRPYGTCCQALSLSTGLFSAYTIFYLLGIHRAIYIRAVFMMKLEISFCGYLTVSFSTQFMGREILYNTVCPFYFGH